MSFKIQIQNNFPNDHFHELFSFLSCGAAIILPLCCLTVNTYQWRESSVNGGTDEENYCKSISLVLVASLFPRTWLHRVFLGLFVLGVGHILFYDQICYLDGCGLYWIKLNSQQIEARGIDWGCQIQNKAILCSELCADSSVQRKPLACYFYQEFYLLPTNG